jgi:hypothetical protein
VVVETGVTAKLTPLPDVPIAVPPEDTVYHLMVPIVEVALRLEETPQMIDEGVAVTLPGAPGGFTVTVTEVRVGFVHVLNDSA